jgi:aspartate/methionine/tyrosine aminotransferase
LNTQVASSKTTQQEQTSQGTTRDDITQHEIEALKTEFNLADAHTHQSQSPTQRQIVADLPNLWYKSERETQYQAEQEFIQTFYQFHGQHTALKRKEDIYLVYAASVGMHITATYLMQRKLSVGLIEPCFDNLHDLMKHMQVPMHPLDESIFFDKAKIYDNLMEKALMLDAIVLVDPNNPTGFSLFADDDEAFLEVVRFCQDYNKLLILDFSFSAFIKASGGQRYDVYSILENSGVSYISMEDTGKTWPIQDAKCSSILCSKDIDADVYPIVTSVLLNVSPFILNIVTSYIKDSAKDNFHSVSSLLNRNRDYARKELNGEQLTFVESMIDTSVAWFEINDPDLTADELHEHMLKYNVYVLSGKYFYWHNADKGQRFIRLALARDSEILFRSVDTIKEALNDLNK